MGNFSCHRKSSGHSCNDSGGRSDLSFLEPSVKENVPKPINSLTENPRNWKWIRVFTFTQPQIMKILLYYWQCFLNEWSVQFGLNIQIDLVGLYGSPWRSRWHKAPKTLNRLFRFERRPVNMFWHHRCSNRKMGSPSWISWYQMQWHWRTTEAMIW